MPQKTGNAVKVAAAAAAAAALNCCSAVAGLRGLLAKSRITANLSVSRILYESH